MLTLNPNWKTNECPQISPHPYSYLKSPRKHSASVLRFFDSMLPKKLILISAALLLLRAGTGWAQPQLPSDSLLRLKELSVEQLSELHVVTTVASLSDAGALDVGSTVEAVSRESWRRRGARTVADALGHLPGTLLAPSSSGGSILSIRGYTTATSIRGVNTRLDGVPVNGLLFGTALFDLPAVQLGALRRVEMIRGPGSALYGADAFHGVLSLETFSSDADVTEAEAGMGGDLYRESALRLSRGLGGGARFDGAAAYSGQPGQSRSYSFTDRASGAMRSSAREEEYESFMAVLKLRSDPGQPASGRLGLVLKGHNQERFPGDGRTRAAQMSASDFSASDSRFALLHGALERELPRGVAVEAKAYGWADRASRFLGGAGKPIDFRTRDRRAGAALLASQAENPWRTPWTAGYEFAHLDVPEYTENGVSGAPEGYAREVHSLLVSAHSELAGDALRLLYGARWDQYSDAADHLSPRAGLILKPAPDWAVKLLYGHAYRPPTAVEARGASFIAPAPGDPETLDSWEFGVLNEGERHRAFAVLFANRWDDAILTVPNPDPVKIRAFRNVGENRARGLETGLSWLGDVSRADLSGSYVESRDKTNDRAYGAFPRVILNAGAGLATPGVPVELYLQNRVHLGANEGPGSSFVADPKKLKDYWRTDLSATWRPRDAWEVYANVLNLLDRRNYFPSPLTAEGGVLDRALTVSAGLRLRW